MNYFAFIFKKNKIRPVIKIPPLDSTEGLFNSIWLYNTPANNCVYFIYKDKTHDCDEKLSTSILERIDLINSLDLTGDNKKNEFIITGTQIMCGYTYRLIVGYNEKYNKIMMYPVAVEGNYWVFRFIPRGGKCSVEILCGDHGGDTYTRKDYKFDNKKSRYNLIYDENKECTEVDY